MYKISRKFCQKGSFVPKLEAENHSVRCEQQKKNALSVGIDVLRNTSPTGLACKISKCENHSVIVESEKKSLRLKGVLLYR